MPKELASKSFVHEFQFYTDYQLQENIKQLRKKKTITNLTSVTHTTTFSQSQFG